MLQLVKNQAVANVAKQQVEIRRLELDWYSTNYSTMTGQAAMLAGFAFSQLTTAMPETHPPPFMLEFIYMILTCTCIGLCLSVILVCTFLSVWGPGLALRGTHGTLDLHKAVRTLRDYQFMVFTYFTAGWVVYFISVVLLVWIYFKKEVAAVVSLPMSIFVFLVIYYTTYLTGAMRVPHDEAVEGKIDAFSPYEKIGDLDRALEGDDSGNMQNMAVDGYAICPIVEEPES